MTIRKASQPVTNTKNIKLEKENIQMKEILKNNNMTKLIANSTSSENDVSMDDLDDNKPFKFGRFDSNVGDTSS
jgi:hypothetical protein